MGSNNKLDFSKIYISPEAMGDILNWNSTISDKIMSEILMGPEAFKIKKARELISYLIHSGCPLL